MQERNSGARTAHSLRVYSRRNARVRLGLKKRRVIRSAAAATRVRTAYLASSKRSRIFRFSWQRFSIQQDRYSFASLPSL